MHSLNNVLLFYFLFYSFNGEVIKIGGFGTYEACKSYQEKVVIKEGSKMGKCKSNWQRNVSKQSREE